MKLKPCPFCGAAGENHNFGGEEVEGVLVSLRYWWMPNCPKCDFTIPTEGGFTEEESAALWNTRPEEDMLRKIIEGLINVIDHEYESRDRDPCNNDNYCRAKDALKGKETE